jgi:uncharacterized protein (TIGR02231 family)
MLAAQKRQRTIDDEVAKLASTLAELSPDEDRRTEVVVHVEAAAALTGVLRVSYRVQDASWMPFYDARLRVGDGKAKPTLDLVQRAEVTQATGESWDNVLLTLSTARTGGATTAPDMASWEISKLEPLARMEADGVAAPAALADAEMKLDDAAQELGAAKTRNVQLAKPKAIAQQQVTLQLAGFQARYEIGGRVSVDNAGQSKKVRIASHQMEAGLMAVTVPRLDETAYLTATFKVAGLGPQLPGQVNLYRDGVFMGQGALPLLNPGEVGKLGFGVDDLVKVTRAEVKRVAGAEGILTSSNVDERAWDITVKNLHDFDLPVRVVDRTPFTAAKDIEVEDVAGMSPPSLRDLDHRRGVLAWDFTLPAGADNTLKTGYKISWPDGMQVSVVE